MTVVPLFQESDPRASFRRVPPPRRSFREGWRLVMWRDHSELLERLLILISLVVGTTLLWALYQRDANWSNCSEAPPEKRIRACTAIIDSGFEFAAMLSRAYSNRGSAFRGQGDLDRAIEDYDEAIRLNPFNSRALHNRGVLHGEGGFYHLALEDFGQAIRFAPRYANAWNGRCWTKVIMGQPLQAISDCSQSLRLKADAVTLRSRALAFLKLGQLNDAIADYDAALKLTPKSAAALFGRGLAKQLKNDQSAVSDIAAARAINAGIADEFAKYGLLLQPEPNPSAPPLDRPV